MRPLFLAFVLTAPLLAGCLSDGDTADGSGPTEALHGDPELLATYDAIPGDASYVPIDGGMALVWTDQERPFNATFVLPEGASMVRFVADPGEEETVDVAMWNEDTGRRRCNQQSVVDLNEPLRGPRSCSSIAYIDDPGTPWSVRTGSGDDPLPEVRVEFYHTALDGPAAAVDWAKLSKATHDLQPTQGFHIASHDGLELWVEVTLPEGQGPWPTVVAASPYNGQLGRIGESWSGPDDAGTPAMWRYWTQDWAKRGYAAVNVDVRGFGLSDGCIEVWGRNEQLDQKFTVEWVTRQDWSDGHVGFYGQSYVATTPLAAAVHQAKGLDAVIMVAPVVDAYYDWHYGGVPNGESSGSPAAYQVLTDAPPTPPTSGEPGPTQSYLMDMGTDLPTIIEWSAKGLCDPTLAPRANDPRAIHNEFYDERDFGAKAGDITAATLYTQGFEDANVKSAMIGDMWNDITAPKLGLYGHWLHQHPPRMDAEVLFLGWMEEHVKGIDLGITDAYPDAIVSVDPDTRREAATWPPEPFHADPWHMDFDADTITRSGGAGSADIDLFPASTLNTQDTQAGPVGTYQHVLESEALSAPLPLVAPKFEMDLTLQGENAMVYARLDEVREDGSERLLSWGMKNLALRWNPDTYDPIVPGTRFTDTLTFRPTEHIVADGSTLRLTIRGVQATEPLGTALPQPGLLTVHGEGTYLAFHDISLDAYEPIPLTERP